MRSCTARSCVPLPEDVHPVTLSPVWEGAWAVVARGPSLLCDVSERRTLMRCVLYQFAASCWHSICSSILRLVYRGIESAIPLSHSMCIFLKGH